MTTTMGTDLFAIEHAKGIHQVFSPRACIDCNPGASAPPVVAPPPRPSIAHPVDGPAPDPPQPPRENKGNLADAFRKIRERLMVVPDDDYTAPVTLDGDPFCEACNGFRWLADRSDPFGSTKSVRCPACVYAPWAVQRRVDKLLGLVPERFKDFRLETFPLSCEQQADMVDQATAWLDAPGEPSLYLHGPYGRGKSGLAVALLFRLAFIGKSVAFKIVPDLLAMIKATYNSADALEYDERSMLHLLATVDVLCFDDVGREYHRGPEDWATEKVFQVVNGRHGQLKRTVLTSNYSLRALSDRVGMATGSRIQEMVRDTAGRSWVLDFSGLPNLRAEPTRR